MTSVGQADSPAPRAVARTVSYRARVPIFIRVSEGVLLIGAFFLWTNRGVNIRIQILSIAQFASIVGAAICIFCVFAYPRLVPRQTLRLFSAITFAAALVVFVALLSSITAQQPLNSIRFLGRYVYGVAFLFAVAVTTYGRVQFLRRIVLSFLVGGVANTVLCAAGHILPSIGAIVFQDSYSKRAQGLLNHPNQLAMIYVGAIILTFWPKLLPGVLKFTTFGVLLLGLLMTGSKFNIGLAAIAIPLTLCWVPLREGRYFKATFYLAISCGFVLFAGLVGGYLLQNYSPIYYDRVSEFINDPTDAATTEARVQIWSLSMDCFGRNPVLGIGAANATVCLPFPHAHNVLLNYLLETGVVGLSSFLVFIATAFYCLSITNLRWQRFTRPPENSASLLPSIAGVFLLLSNMVSDSLGPATMPLLWLYISLGIGLSSCLPRPAHNR